MRESLGKMHVYVEKVAKLDAIPTPSATSHDNFSKKHSSHPYNELDTTPRAMSESHHQILNASVDKQQINRSVIECISELDSENELSCLPPNILD